MNTPSDLIQFPRPSVAVDVAVLSVVPSGPSRQPTLAVLLIHRRTRTHTGRWSLPGSFVHERERLAVAVRRTLLDKAGIDGLSPRQLLVLDDPRRDARGWVLSVAHVETVPADRTHQVADPSLTTWVPVQDLPPTDIAESDADPEGWVRTIGVVTPDGSTTLPFDHDRILDLAVHDLRRRYLDRPDPDHLLSGPFAISELRAVHEAVLGHPLQKDTFRRMVLPHLRQVAGPTPGSVGRPAARYITAS